MFVNLNVRVSQRRDPLTLFADISAKLKEVGHRQIGMMYCSNNSFGNNLLVVDSQWGSPLLLAAAGFSKTS